MFLWGIKQVFYVLCIFWIILPVNLCIRRDSWGNQKRGTLLQRSDQESRCFFYFGVNKGHTPWWNEARDRTLSEHNMNSSTQLLCTFIITATLFLWHDNTGQNDEEEELFVKRSARGLFSKRSPPGPKIKKTAGGTLDLTFAILNIYMYRLVVIS